MNHGVRECEDCFHCACLDFTLRSTLGPFGKFHLFPWIALEIGMQLSFPVLFLKFCLFLQFGLISFDKGGN